MLTHLHPDAAIALLTLGIALLYLELNRPGAILPGALGLLATLFALASLSHAAPRPIGVLLLATSALTLAAGLRRSLPPLVVIAATVTLIAGLFTLVHTPSNQIHAATSLVCGLILGAGSAVLATIAHRARRNKGLD